MREKFKLCIISHLCTHLGQLLREVGVTVELLFPEVTKIVLAHFCHIVTLERCVGNILTYTVGVSKKIDSYLNRDSSSTDSKSIHRIPKIDSHFLKCYCMSTAIT